MANSHACPFTILATQSPPFKYLDAHNQPAGLHVDIWKIILEELKVPYEINFVDWGSKRVKTEIEKGNAEVHFSLSKKQSRLRLYVYPEESYHSQLYSFFIRSQDKNKINYQTLEDLKGLTIGATESYTYTKEFWAAGLNLDLTTNNSLHINKLLLGRIDMAILKKHASLYNLGLKGEQGKVFILPKPLVHKKTYAAFSKASKHKDKEYVIKNYGRIIRRLRAQGILNALYIQYFQQL
jgi:polar amino acid transport system substrate-binding protein